MRIENLTKLKNDSINEIEAILNEITGIQIERLKHGKPNADDLINDDTISQDFERLERLINIVCEINELLERRRKNHGK